MAVDAIEQQGIVGISGSEAGLQELAQHHRGHDPNSGYVRKSFENHDRKAGFGFRANFSTFPASVYSPRHRHNFEQVRFIVDGAWEYARRRYGGGWLGFFPEGTFYGPAKSLEPGHHFVIQYPGPTNAPFVRRKDEREVQRAMVEGGAVFKEGICIWPDGRKQDGGEALWESWAGQRINYPQARYGEPVWLDTNTYDWQPSTVPGVAVRHLAAFGDTATSIDLLRLEPGAEVPAGRNGPILMRFVCDGEVEYGGRTYAAASSLYYPLDAAREALTSRTGATILSIQVRGQRSGPAV
jgi:hypothetical protein